MSIAEEIDFFKRSEDWPRWPILPLVQRDGGIRKPLGLVFAQYKPPYVVFTGANLFALPEIVAELEHPTWRQALEKAGAERVEYSTLEELFAVWRID